MTAKEQALTLITQLGADQTVSEAELIAAYHKGVDQKTLPERHRQSSIAWLLYVLGAAILVVGIGLFSIGYWQNFSAGTHILLTLGVAVASYSIAVLLNEYASLKGLTTICHIIAGILFPVGILVTMDSAGLNINSPAIQTLIGLILLGLYVASYRLMPRLLFLIFTITSATWLYFAVTNWVIQNSIWQFSNELPLYAILVAGVSYLLLGQALLKTTHNRLSGWLGLVGSVAFLGSGLALGSPTTNVTFELIFPLLAFAVMYLSIIRKTMIYLIVGASFLVFYVLKLSFEYFSNSVGWPFALIISGVVLIALGYVSLRLKERYIQA
jgi:hypothetical protein